MATVCSIVVALYAQLMSILLLVLIVVSLQATATGDAATDNQATGDCPMASTTAVVGTL
jgi:hypothetical protein